MLTQSQKTGFDYSEIAYVKRVGIGSANPNHPLTEEQSQAQIDLLNKCLGSGGKGRIIGKDITVGVYQFGEHQITMQRITYHVGFKRKPYWLTD